MCQTTVKAAATTTTSSSSAASATAAIILEASYQNLKSLGRYNSVEHRFTDVLG
jgi:hypothetical protein